ncbi:hypothetical protein BJY04DRAFT_187007 [Aspergillus karnatakaensis]|uniref:Zn(II)2Cys6 transcription factor n=1 Tax=Aspergillus karnatakaensis TaxID=1810916 RepID=UPI003CCE00F8
MGPPRKPHKKSRKGCIECKRRHVKCDESRPRCVNCTVSARHCSYEDLVSSARTLLSGSYTTRPKTKHSTASHRRNPPSPSPVRCSPQTPESGSLSGTDSPSVNKLHLELFHHFVSHILSLFCLDHHLSSAYSSLEMTKCILSAPFLMNEILAFAALHLSIVHPLQQRFYHHHAAELQTHALTEFNNGANIEINADTCLPIFLFSSILALHMLCDKLLFRADDFGDFLQDFVQSLRLHRGVRAVTNQSWPLLLQSPLKSLLEAEQLALDGKHVTPGTECSTLLTLTNSASTPTSSSNSNSTKLDTPTLNTYRETIKSLQLAFDASGRVSTTNHPFKSPFSAAGAIISWPVIIPPRYIDLLEEKRPESLAILAHFGALLHLHRSMWTFGDSGKYVVQSVAEYLGDGWKEWVRWPVEVVQREEDEQQQTDEIGTGPGGWAADVRA